MVDPDEESARAQRRMERLLDAVLAVSRELELPVVLRRIVSTAMELVDARYGALGVLVHRRHLPPLVVTADGHASYLEAEPGLPLGVDESQPRPDHTRALKPGTRSCCTPTVWSSTPAARWAPAWTNSPPRPPRTAPCPLKDLCRLPADRHPGSGLDDLALLAIRPPSLP
ncbi:hypothetical protein GCM10009601_09680 [Streptomyces thermospinosisporus]|uniref:PPM-type phosphatase domain-containing protein n=1 Tax=Streptomyces thermospinosisporus TaxID=161482 RepID=A0ABN1YLD6_9ACTN